jgi:hypothetical protein
LEIWKEINYFKIFRGFRNQGFITYAIAKLTMLSGFPTSRSQRTNSDNHTFFFKITSNFMKLLIEVLSFLYWLIDTSLFEYISSYSKFKARFRFLCELNPNDFVKSLLTLLYEFQRFFLHVTRSADTCVQATF